MNLLSPYEAVTDYTRRKPVKKNEGSGETEAVLFYFNKWIHGNLLL